MPNWGALVDVRPLDREPAARERALVLSSWILSWSPHAQPALTPAQAEPIVEDHLGRCAEVLVATVPGVDRTVCGWVALLGPSVLGYLYVLRDYRRRGIAARLLDEVGIDPRGPRWRYAFGTPRLRKLCRPDPRRPERIPWRGVPNGQDVNRIRAAR